MDIARTWKPIPLKPGDFEAVLTIDGATGSGKSRLLRGLARRYGCETIELGLVVRTVAWLAMREQRTAADAVAKLAALSRNGDFELISSTNSEVAASQVLLGGRSRLNDVLGPHLAPATAAVSMDENAMDWVHSYVRELARGKQAAISGRRAGSAACPDAGLKIRLEASWGTRRARKSTQREDLGLRFAVINDAAILPNLEADQLSIDTDGLDANEMVARVSNLVEQRLGWSETSRHSAHPLIAA